MSPNPATSDVTIEFDNTDFLEALPDQIDLFSERFKNPVRSVKVKEVFERKAFKNGKSIELDTKDLPRGTYYLHVTDSKKKGEKVDAIRLILE